MDPVDRSPRFFVALLSHDISNFNQTTRGYLEMLLGEQMGEISEEQSRVLTTCLRQCQRVESLIDGIRQLERLEATPPQLEPIDLDDVSRQAIESVQTELADRDIRVRFSPGRRRALAEPYLLDLLRQLIGNAARHNDCEIVEVDLSFASQDGDPPMWEITVTDNGNGVPPAKKDSLFDRLESGEVHGAGIGLSVARTLVRRWGGEIALADTAEGEGASLVVRVPRA